MNYIHWRKAKGGMILLFVKCKLGFTENFRLNFVNKFNEFSLLINLNFNFQIVKINHLEYNAAV